VSKAADKKRRQDDATLLYAAVWVLSRYPELGWHLAKIEELKGAADQLHNRTQVAS
jgi:hypothetical protein